MTAEKVLALAIAHRARIATAESCTGGLVAAALTDIPGSSEVFERGFVSYSNGAKSEMLGVPPDLIARHGAVSEEVARAMAEGALRRSDATLAVSITGVAGPGASEKKPEGLVCFGLAVEGQPTLTRTMRFGAIGRQPVRAASVAEALALMADALASSPKK